MSKSGTDAIVEHMDRHHVETLGKFAEVNERLDNVEADVKDIKADVKDIKSSLGDPDEKSTIGG